MFFALIPFSLSLVQAYILLSSNNEKIDMWLNIFNVLLNTILAFLLIKFIGSLGSVTAITISFILFYILQSIILKRKKIDFLQNIKIEVTILISLVLITLLISEYSIFPKIPAPILLTISIANNAMQLLYNIPLYKSINVCMISASHILANLKTATRPFRR